MKNTVATLLLFMSAGFIALTLLFAMVYYFSKNEDGPELLKPLTSDPDIQAVGLLTVGFNCSLSMILSGVFFYWGVRLWKAPAIRRDLSEKEFETFSPNEKSVVMAIGLFKFLLFVGGLILIAWLIWR